MRYKAVPDQEAVPVVSTPSADRTAPSPAPPTSIGPTPHRDGKVLGLFAFLEETPQKTPSKGPADAAGLETPSKAVQEDVEAKLGRTPGSASKRRYLDNLVTPLKPADGNVQRTPTSVSKLQFGTPSFLRRRSLAPVDEMPEYQSPEKLRRTSRRPFARGLSAIVANLRRVEESAFDDEEEAMREMEGAVEEPGAGPAPAAVHIPDVVVADSQAVPDNEVVPEEQPGMRMLGGFDDEAAYDSPTEKVTDRGRPMKEFKIKKKGQKRTTRRVKMKPTFVSRPAEEVAGVEDEAVPETQVDVTAGGVSDLEDGDYEGAAKESRGRKRKAGEEKGEKATASRGHKRKGGDGEKGGTVRKAARKVNELAHANFRRLKIKGKGGKGGGGRFRRR